MGGRAAEELMFHKQTTGAGDDINKATDIARKMVCNWGMSEKMGPLSFGKDEEMFLGREMGGGRNFSERVAEDIDREIHRLVTTGYKKAVNILKANRQRLEDLAESLLIKETLDRDQIDRLMGGENIVTDDERKAFLEAQRKSKGDSIRKPQRTLEEVVEETPSAPPFKVVPQGT
jgi:cell division protease FtsH